MRDGAADATAAAGDPDDVLRKRRIRLCVNDLAV
jgi:hypothetical protein